MKTNFTVRSYNCNGLGNQNKLRRVLIKVREEVKNGGVVLLKETHIKDESLISMYWKTNFVSSCSYANILILVECWDIKKV